MQALHNLIKMFLPFLIIKGEVASAMIRDRISPTAFTVKVIVKMVEGSAPAATNIKNDDSVDRFYHFLPRPEQ